jgi:hypothetical protein
LAGTEPHRRVIGDRITYVRLDVHKEGIVVAVAESGIDGEIREYGRIENTTTALNPLAGKLGGDGVRLSIYRQSFFRAHAVY